MKQKDFDKLCKQLEGVVKEMDGAKTNDELEKAKIKGDKLVDQICSSC